MSARFRAFGKAHGEGARIAITSKDQVVAVDESRRIVPAGPVKAAR